MTSEGREVPCRDKKHGQAKKSDERAGIASLLPMTSRSSEFGERSVSRSRASELFGRSDPHEGEREEAAGLKESLGFPMGSAIIVTGSSIELSPSTITSMTGLNFPGWKEKTIVVSVFDGYYFFLSLFVHKRGLAE
jgi:hypothetical protein